MNDEYYREGGPVFLYDAGESNADWAAKTLANSTSFIAELLREFGGLGITWEHRLVNSTHLRHDTDAESIDTMESPCRTLSMSIHPRNTSSTLRPSRLWQTFHTSHRLSLLPTTMRLT